MSVFRTYPQVMRPTESEHIFTLAPIPFFCKKLEEMAETNEAIIMFAKSQLDDRQRLMGEELPGRPDLQRQQKMRGFSPTYLIGDLEQWVEARSTVPVGSHYWTPPNEILNYEETDICRLKETILHAINYTLLSIGFDDVSELRISESWIQFYAPHDGRGHNLHCHSRYRSEEEADIMWSGAYYLDDGEPVKDHIYSGKFVFNIRGYSYVIRPHPGLLMMWPSDLLHEVKPFYGQRERVVINFNILASSVSE